MAIRHLYTVVGEYAMRGEDDKTTIAGIFHNIQGSRLPITKMRVAIAVAFWGDYGDDYRVTIDKPDGTCLVELGKDTLQEPPPLREYQQWSMTAVGIANLSLDQVGVHHVTLWSGGKPVHQYPIGVVLVEAEEGVQDHG